MPDVDAVQPREGAAAGQPAAHAPEHAPGHAQAKRILALVCLGHWLSNFYALCLPALIPFLKDSFAVSYTLLGVMLTTRAVTTGTMQLPIGILVDRLGARAVLSVGVVSISAGFGLLAVVPGFWWSIPLMVVFGIGMASIRPCNYVIITASMPAAYMGRAFGVNMFAGHTGRVVAPPLIVTAAVLWGWRAAVIAAAAIGISATVILVTQWRHVRDDAAMRPRKPKGGSLAEVRSLASVSLFLFLLFYLLNALVSHGIHSFTVATLAQLHDTPLTVASGALTAYLIASAAGVLAGGFLVDKTPRHRLVAGAALTTSAGLLVLLGAVPMPIAGIFAIMAVVGLCQGNVRPARDMLLRAIIPQGMFGKAIGMVSTGAAMGGAAAPILFGWILDQGRAEYLYYVLALCLVLMMVTIVAPKARVGGESRD